MTPVVRLVFVVLVVLAVLPALVAHRPPPGRVAVVRGGAGRHGTAGRGRAPPRLPPDHPDGPSPNAWRRPVAVPVVGAGAVASTVAVGVMATAALAATAAAAWHARGRTLRRRQEVALAADVPEVADLWVVAAGAGLTVPLAVEAVGRRGAGPLARQLAAAAAEAAAGRRLGDVLDDLPSRAGEAARPLAAALLACLRDGAPVLPTLTALAVEAREHERRRVEQAARRVPVLLLFPLVLCVLPAFALLTVAPLVADAITALRL
jgi:hypothetical protein